MIVIFTVFNKLNLLRSTRKFKLVARGYKDTLLPQLSMLYVEQTIRLLQIIVTDSCTNIPTLGSKERAAKNREKKEEGQGAKQPSNLSDNINARASN